jgi:hypothetical protein
MPSINGNAALDVLIGLIFLYFLLSIVCSSVQEAIAAAIGLRARNLEQGVRSLLDNDQGNTDTFYKHWRIQALIKPGKVVKWRYPSYIPARAFALTLLDTFAPPTSGHSDDLIARAKRAIAPKGAAAGHDTIRGLLVDALDDARGDVDRFRTTLEGSFNEVMDRASGWYKRRVQLILFVIAIVLVAAINADSFAIGQRLWKDPALRAATVANATKIVTAGQAQCVKQTKDQGPAATTAACVSSVQALSLPIGWSHSTSPHSLADVLGKIGGLLVTAFALTLGAPFWFDLLGKVANLRGSGNVPKPPPAPSGGSSPPAQTPASDQSGQG